MSSTIIAPAPSAAQAAKAAKAANAARVHRREQLSRKVVNVTSVALAIVTTGTLIYIVSSVLRHPIAGTVSTAPVIAAVVAEKPTPPAAPVKQEEPKPTVVAAVVSAPAPPAAPVLPRAAAGHFVLSSDHHAITITDAGGKDLTLGLAHPLITFDHQAIEIDGLKPDLVVNVLYAGSEATLIEQETPPPPPVAAAAAAAPAPVVAQAANPDKPKKKNKKKKQQTPPPAAAPTTPAATTPPTN
jgi:hypothetical protein